MPGVLGAVARLTQRAQHLAREHARQRVRLQAVEQTLHVRGRDATLVLDGEPERRQKLVQLVDVVRLGRLVNAVG